MDARGAEILQARDHHDHYEEDDHKEIYDEEDDDYKEDDFQEIKRLVEEVPRDAHVEGATVHGVVRGEEGHAVA